MKKLSSLLFGFLLLAIAPGCSSLKRFKSVTYRANDPSLVDMELFGASLSPADAEPGGRNLWDLSASAQTQLIQILNERYPDNGQFVSALGNEYVGKSVITSRDLTRQDLRMVFTISKFRDYKAINDASARFSPADRIEYLRFSLEIPEDYNLTFRDWNRYTTEFGEIEIADVSFSRSLEISADGSPGGIEDAGMKGTISRREDQEVFRRYMKMNGSISRRIITIEEEGTRGIDLTGNVIADVSMEFSGYPEKITVPVFAGEVAVAGKPPAVEALSFTDVVIPFMEEAPDTIRALLTLDYIYRHVQSGWKTYQEWDDRVEYYSGTVKKEVPLFTTRDYLPSFYGIGVDHPEKAAIRVRTVTGKDYPLQFKDYPDAVGFYEWLRNLSEPDQRIDPGTAGPIRIGSTTLVFNGKELTVDQLTENEDIKVILMY